MQPEDNAGQPETTAPADAQHSRARDSNERPTAAEDAAEQTRLKKIAFISAYANCGSRTKAALAVGIDRTTHYFWLRTDADYKKEFDVVAEEVLGLLEDEAFRRAHDGVERVEIGRVARDKDGPIVDVDGKFVIRREYSDRLLEILLKANKPAKYRERMELTGADGGPIETHELSDTERAARIAAIVDAARARRTGSPAEGETEVGAVPGPADTSGGDGSV